MFVNLCISQLLETVEGGAVHLDAPWASSILEWPVSMGFDLSKISCLAVPFTLNREGGRGRGGDRQRKREGGGGWGLSLPLCSVPFTFQPTVRGTCSTARGGSNRGLGSPIPSGGTFVFDCVSGGIGPSLILGLLHLAENFFRTPADKAQDRSNRGLGSPIPSSGTPVFDCFAGGNCSSLILDLAENFAGHLQTKHKMVSNNGPLQNSSKLTSIPNQPKKAKQPKVRPLANQA